MRCQSKISFFLCCDYYFWALATVFNACKSTLGVFRVDLFHGFIAMDSLD